jgi:hypothetical protein
MESVGAVVGEENVVGVCLEHLTEAFLFLKCAEPQMGRILTFL